MNGIEPLIPAPPATGTGNSTGTTTLAVTAVTGRIYVPSTVTGTGVPAGTTIVTGPQAGGAGTYITNQVTTLTDEALTFTPASTVPVFPDFVPPFPPVAAGNPPPPPFPPPSIPVPPGPLGGPVFPPSSGTSHTSPSYTNPYVFPGFTVTLLNPPITVSNILTVPTYVPGPPPHWLSTLPPYIVTTPPVPTLANGDMMMEPAPASLSAAATPRRGRRRAAYARDLHY